MSTENVAAAQRDRQGWALAVYETGRGRQLLQTGRLPDAAAILEEHFTLDSAHRVVSVLDAAGAAALGRVALHTGDRGQARQAAEIAHVMLGQSAPSVRRHAAWLLALQAMADGDPPGAHRWLCALGEDERMSILPLFPMDVADEPRLVHIALAAQDHELAVHAAASAQRRSAGRSRVHQPRGGRAPVRLASYRQRLPTPCIRQARRQLAGRADQARGNSRLALLNAENTSTDVSLYRMAEGERGPR